MRCAQSVPKECQMPTQEHPTPTKTKGRNASNTLTFRPLFDHDKRFYVPLPTQERLRRTAPLSHSVDVHVGAELETTPYEVRGNHA